MLKASVSGCGGGSAAGASYFVVFPEKDSPHPVGAICNRDQGICTEANSSASIASNPEASRMKPLLTDESPASKPPPQPLFGRRLVVVSEAVVVVVIVIGRFQCEVSASGSRFLECRNGVLTWPAPVGKSGVRSQRSGARIRYRLFLR
ncbi:MAG: hypothetical protein R6U13_04830 [Desulfatiglandaceae bacterium]